MTTPENLEGAEGMYGNPDLEIIEVFNQELSKAIDKSDYRKWQSANSVPQLLLKRFDGFFNPDLGSIQGGFAHGIGESLSRHNNNFESVQNQALTRVQGFFDGVRSMTESISRNVSSLDYDTKSITDFCHKGKNLMDAIIQKTITSHKKTLRLGALKADVAGRVQKQIGDTMK